MCKTILWISVVVAVVGSVRPLAASEPCFSVSDAYSHRSDAGIRPVLAALVPTVYLRIRLQNDRNGDRDLDRTVGGSTKSSAFDFTIDSAAATGWEFGLRWYPVRIVRTVRRSRTTGTDDRRPVSAHVRELCRRRVLMENEPTDATEPDVENRLERELLRRQLRALEEFYESE